MDEKGAGARIIPAYAGSTNRVAPCAYRKPDHPRIRGEHRPRTSIPFNSDGSSPHTRGALGRIPARLDGGRIIPAYAGSTSSSQYPDFDLQDHPRIRGEHLHFLTSIPSKSGSSPHTRGAPQAPRKGPDWPWIIPAYAGSTWRARALVSSGRDHPRIRGEHHQRGGGGGLSAGSSPHTRGALALVEGAGDHARIIPAYAGSTNRSHPL